MGLIWRSQPYTKVIRGLDGLSGKYKASVSTTLLARRRFDQCRIESPQINPKAPVCCGLPENCYEPMFLSNLTIEARAALRMKPASNLLQVLPPLISEELQWLYLINSQLYVSSSLKYDHVYFSILVVYLLVWHLYLWILSEDFKWEILVPRETKTSSWKRLTVL